MNRHHMHPYTNMHREPEPEMEQPEVDQENAQNPAAEPAIEKPEQTQTEAAPEPSAEEKLQKELQEERLRMAAEMDNFKKRLQREHEEMKKEAAKKVLEGLLPALDNLDLAIQYGSKHEACADMMVGIEMTRKQLLETLAKNGLTAVGAPGEQFDPAIHEAVGMEANPEYDKGAVTKILQNGYKLNDKLLRPAKVMVNN